MPLKADASWALEPVRVEELPWSKRQEQGWPDLLHVWADGPDGLVYSQPFLIPQAWDVTLQGREYITVLGVPGGTACSRQGQENPRALSERTEIARNVDTLQASQIPAIKIALPLNVELLPNSDPKPVSDRRRGNLRRAQRRYIQGNHEPPLSGPDSARRIVP